MKTADEHPRDMESTILSIARRKIGGGPQAPFFKTPYLDAAFNGDIFFWDTCFIAGWAKYYPELPITQALDNFYQVQRSDGHIGRQYAPDGQEVWDSRHPISMNPPLLAWAELELHLHGFDQGRLAKNYGALCRFHKYLESMFRNDDGLFHSDSHGSGMDNLLRSPRGWKPDEKGIPLDASRCHPQVQSFINDYLYREDLNHAVLWNRQGRSVDFSAQMAFDARNLADIANKLGFLDEETQWRREADGINEAINKHCWTPATGFYNDLGYGRQIDREHIGMFWTLWSGAAQESSIVNPLVSALEDPSRFGRPFPVPSLSASDPDYRPWGDYWRGGVWAPTSYMVLRGLAQAQKMDCATRLARKMVDCVDEVFANTGTLWENYAPEFLAYGNPARPDFCGWTPLIPISVVKEFLSS